jgi:hypothetical protein
MAQQKTKGALRGQGVQRRLVAAALTGLVMALGGPQFSPGWQ